MRDNYDPFFENEDYNYESSENNRKEENPFFENQNLSFTSYSNNNPFFSNDGFPDEKKSDNPFLFLSEKEQDFPTSSNKPEPPTQQKPDDDGDPSANFGKGNGNYNGGGYNGGDYNNGNYNGGGYSRQKNRIGLGVILAIMIPLLVITNIITSAFVFSYVWDHARTQLEAELEAKLNKETNLPYNVDLIAANIAKSQMQSVVEVTSQSPTGVSSGTGFIITESGYFLTNAHVVTYSTTIREGIGIGSSFKNVTEVAPKIIVKFEHNDLEYSVTVIDYNTDLDLAVCKIEATNNSFDPVTFYDSTLLDYGEPCVAIGNAQGYGLAVTEGIISSPIQYFNLSSRGYTAAIQHSAAINPGNSGGPLFNMYGMVIGLNSFKLTDNSDIAIDGMGFAIPSAVAKDYVNGLNLTDCAISYEELPDTASQGNSDQA